MKMMVAMLLLSMSLIRVHGHGYLNIPVARRLEQKRGLYTGLTAFGAGMHITNCGAGGLSSPSSEDVITTLERGTITKFQIGVDAHHAGHLELRLCSFQISSDDEDISGCKVLNRASAAEAGVTDCTSDDPRDICGAVDPINPGWWYLAPKNGLGKNHDMWFHIPSNMDCSDNQCTVQFTWKTANSCNPHPLSYCNYYNTVEGPQNGWCKNWYCGGLCNSGSGAPDNCEATMGNRLCCSEVFTNCAEVRLTGTFDGSAPQPSPRPSPRPAPLPIPAPSLAPTTSVATLSCTECKTQCSKACSNNNGRNQCWGSPLYFECTCSDGSQHSIPGCECDPARGDCPSLPAPEPETDPSQSNMTVPQLAPKPGPSQGTVPQPAPKSGTGKSLRLSTTEPGASQTPSQGPSMGPSQGQTLGDASKSQSQTPLELSFVGCTLAAVVAVFFCP